jgi:hypothetical protein
VADGYTGVSEVVLLLVLLAPLAAGVVPMPPFPDCGPDAIESCPSDLDDWDHISWIPETSIGETRPAEIELGSGLSLDVALRTTAGRWEIAVAVVDSGIQWDRTDLVRKVRLNTAELPFPQDASGADQGVYDLDGNGLVNIDDYANDPRVDPTAGADAADFHRDASDLIALFSDGVDDDGNGYPDDIAGWDFFRWDNDPYADMWALYGEHGTGIARGAVAEGDDGGDLGTCPNCSLVPLRTGDAFITDGERLALAYAYAADNGVKVIAHAGAGLTHPGWMRDVVQYVDDRGTFIVAAAADENSYHHNLPALEDPILVVHAVGPKELSSDDSEIYSWMNFGNCNNYGTRLDVVAPSDDCASGATQSTAGAIGLIWSAAADAGLTLTNDEVRALVRATVDDVALTEEERERADTYPSQPGWDGFYGEGRVNLGAAVQAVLASELPPTARITSPRWFDLASGSVTVEGRVTTRGDSVGWVLEVGQGAEPTEWTEVASGDGPVDGVLAEVPVSGFTAFADLADETVVDRFYRAHQPQWTFRLTATDGDGRSSAERRGVFVQDDPDLLPGWPIRLGGSNESSPALFDADGDGDHEVLVVDAGGYVHLFQADGSEVPGWPVTTDVIPHLLGPAAAAPAVVAGAVPPDAHEGLLAGPAVGDVDGDGQVDVVAAGTRGRVYAWGLDGAPKGGFPVALEGRTVEEIGPYTAWDEGVYGAPSLGDVDGDGALEIVVGGSDQKLYVWSGSGQLLPGYPLDMCVDCSVGARIVSGVALGDIDGDGDLDGAFGANEIPPGDAGYLFVVDLTSATQLPGFPLPRNGLINQEILPVVGAGHPSTPALADVDGDGDLEILSPALLSIPGVIHHDGSTAVDMKYAADGFGSDSNFDEGSFLSMVTNPSFGDLDLDGVPDPVLGGAGVMYLLALPLKEWQDYHHALGAWSGATGEALPGFPRQIDDVAFLAAAAVADVSGDGAPEAIYGSGGYFAYAWDATGALAPGFPKFTGGWMIGSPAVGDVDGDGRVEVVVATREGWLFAWGTRGRADQAVQWSGARHDPANTSNYEVIVPPQLGPAGVSTGCCGKGGADSGAWLLVPALWVVRRRRLGRASRG